MVAFVPYSLRDKNSPLGDDLDSATALLGAYFATSRTQIDMPVMVEEAIFEGEEVASVETASVVVPRIHQEVDSADSEYILVPAVAVEVGSLLMASVVDLR